MNEAEWLNCTDPTPLLKFLRRKANCKDSLVCATSRIRYETLINLWL